MEKKTNAQKTEEKTKKQSVKKNSPILFICMIVCLCIMAFAAYKLVTTMRDYHQSEAAYEDLKEEVVSDTGRPSGESETGSAAEESGWWTDVPAVDFDALTGINPDVVGWIRFDDTERVPVDYPILQGHDNDDYLHTNLYGEHYAAGSIFLESANAADFSDCYNIVYGHNMKNGSMFGTLKQYKRDTSLYDELHYFTILTKDRMYRYEIFAYEDVADDSVVYTVGYDHDEAYGRLIDTMVKGSMRDTGIRPTQEDSIVTLSTCSTAGDTVRFVVHGVLIDSREVE